MTMKLTPYPCEGGGFIMTDLEVLPRCTLKKMRSDDGLWEFRDDVAYVGKEYIYSPASRRVEEIHHHGTEMSSLRNCEIVMVWDSRGWFCMMPTECLNFPSP